MNGDLRLLVLGRQPYEGVLEAHVFGIDDPGFVQDRPVLETYLLVRVFLEVKRQPLRRLVAAPDDRALDRAPTIVVGKTGAMRQEENQSSGNQYQHSIHHFSPVFTTA